MSALTDLAAATLRRAVETRNETEVAIRVSFNFTPINIIYSIAKISYNNYGDIILHAY